MGAHMRAVKHWLSLGVIALAVAGFFSIVLVIGRTPALQEMRWAKDLFSVALVVHVDLSVWVWFCSMIAAMLSLNMHTRAQRIPALERAAVITAAIGTACLALSPLEGEWQVIKSNYIPVLNNALFFLGLSLIASGVALMAFETLWQRSSWKRPEGALAVILLLSLSLFIHSGMALSAGYAPEERFEYLFWAGGHTMQHAFSLAMIIAWAALFQRTYQQDIFSTRLVAAFMALSIYAAIQPLPEALSYRVDDGAFQLSFTTAMIRLGGIAPAIALAVVMWRMWRIPKPARLRDAYFTSLVMSMLLFVAGGVLGLMITGQNVTIPAHYHGSIVAVTIALMGYGYSLLPQLGLTSVQYRKAAVLQPVFYALGQLMHIGGLAYSGGYGVLRKSAESTASLAPEVKIALAVMGTGGLLAIIGGLMFVWVMATAFYKARR